MDVVSSVRRAVEAALVEGGLRPPGGRVLVALSGGPDSRVLLDALCALRARLRLTVSVCVVDHGLRAGSAREAAGALELATRLGVEGRVERVRPEDRSARAARDARYGALGRVAAACGAEAIALGHTASDQAETLFDRLLRGAGSRGLGAMAPVRPLPGGILLIRPLLDVARDEIEAYVAREGLAVVRDPSNEDLRFRRSRLRHRVLPLLRAERPDLDRALARLCERLRLDADWLDAEAARAAGEVAVAGAPELLDLSRLAALHPALAARVLRARCEAAGVPADRVPLDALLRLSRGRHGTSSIDLAGAVVAERRYARLRIGPAVAAPGPDDDGPLEISVARAGTVTFGAIALRVPRALLAKGPVVVRRPRAGDRVRGRRLADLLIDQKVARPDRRLLCAVGTAGSRHGLDWVGLIRPETPTEIAWEWPSSGVRPRPALNKTGERVTLLNQEQ